jgi:hypothetical protein
MTKEEDIKPKPGEMVVLMEVPPGMLDDLPPEDQQAINEVVGKPILLNEYDEDGRADLEFKDRHGNFHYNLCSSGIHQGSRTGREHSGDFRLPFYQVRQSIWRDGGQRTNKGPAQERLIK